MQMPWLLILLCTALLACANGYQAKAQTGLAYELVGQASHCVGGHAAETVQLFQSQDAWLASAARQRLNPRLRNEPWREAYLRVLVYGPQQRTGGFSLQLEKVELIPGSPDRVRVIVRSLAPSEHSFTTQMISQPCLLVDVPAAGVSPDVKPVLVSH